MTTTSSLDPSLLRGHITSSDVMSSSQPFIKGQSAESLSSDIPELLELKWELDYMRETVRKFDNTPFRKCQRLSDDFKQTGNRVLKEDKNPRLALHYYNEALKHCPCDDVETGSGRMVPLLYANRSLALQAMNKFDFALKEIDMALQLGYPDREKLIKRRSACQEALDKENQSGVSRKYQSGHVTQERDTNIDSVAMTDRRERDCNSAYEKDKEHFSETRNKEVLPGGFQETVGINCTERQEGNNRSTTFRTYQHHLLKYMSQSIGIFDDSEKGGGREVRATSDIASGALLIQEEAFTYILLPEYFDRFCYHCLRRIWTTKMQRAQNDKEMTASSLMHETDPKARSGESSMPSSSFFHHHHHPFPLLEKEEESKLPLPYPCTSCSQVVFCSVKCRSTAWQEYHSYECCYLNLIHKMDRQILSPCLTLRVLLREGGVDAFLSPSTNNKIFGGEGKKREESSNMEREKKDAGQRGDRVEERNKKMEDFEVKGKGEDMKHKGIHTTVTSDQSRQREGGEGEHEDAIEIGGYERLNSLVFHPHSSTEEESQCKQKASFILAFLLEKSAVPHKKTTTTSVVGISTTKDKMKAGEMIGEGEDQEEQISSRGYSLEIPSSSSTRKETSKSSNPNRTLSLSQLLSLRERICKHMRQCQVNSIHMTYREVEAEEIPILPAASGESPILPEIKPHFRKNPFPSLVERRIGCGTYLTLSFLNHSCDPNAKVIQFDGRVVSLQSTREVKEGEEIFISYGLFSKYHSFVKRQTDLYSTYRFVCSCTACQVREEPQINAFRCQDCHGPVVLGQDDKGEEDDEDGDDESSNVKTSSGGEKRKAKECHSSIEDKGNTVIDFEGISGDREVRVDEGGVRSFCLKCQRHNHLDIRKCLETLSSGSHLLSLGIEKSLLLPSMTASSTPSLSPNGDKAGDDDDDSSVESYLRQGYALLSSVLHDNDMQMAIACDILSSCYKRRRKFGEAVKFARRALHVVSSSFDEDVYLFNTLFKVLDCYRFLLLQLKVDWDKEKKKTPISINTDYVRVAREAEKTVTQFTHHLVNLLPTRTPESSFYVKQISLLTQLIHMK